MVYQYLVIILSKIREIVDFNWLRYMVCGTPAHLINDDPHAFYESALAELCMLHFGIYSYTSLARISREQVI